MFADAISLKDRPEYVHVLMTKGGTPVDVIKYSGHNVLIKTRLPGHGRRSWWAPMSMLYIEPTPNLRRLTARAKPAAR